jgi:hypothetical protein
MMRCLRQLFGEIRANLVNEDHERKALFSDSIPKHIPLVSSVFDRIRDHTLSLVQHEVIVLARNIARNNEELLCGKGNISHKADSNQGVQCSTTYRAKHVRLGRIQLKEHISGILSSKVIPKWHRRYYNWSTQHCWLFCNDKYRHKISCRLNNNTPNCSYKK